MGYAMLQQGILKYQVQELFKPSKTFDTTNLFSNEVSIEKLCIKCQGNPIKCTSIWVELKAIFWKMSFARSLVVEQPIKC